jgi:hypothetical protein
MDTSLVGPTILLLHCIVLAAIVSLTFEGQASELKGLIIRSLLSRRLVVVATTKPNIGHLAPASEVARRHTLPFLKGHGMPILKWYGMSSCDL